MRPQWGRRLAFVRMRERVFAFALPRWNSPRRIIGRWERRRSARTLMPPPTVVRIDAVHTEQIGVGSLSPPSVRPLPGLGQLSFGRCANSCEGVYLAYDRLSNPVIQTRKAS